MQSERLHAQARIQVNQSNLFSEYLDIVEILDEPLSPNWFTDAGITIEGRWWVAPSRSFLERCKRDDAFSDRLASFRKMGSSV